WDDIGDGPNGHAFFCFFVFCCCCWCCNEMRKKTRKRKAGSSRHRLNLPTFRRPFLLCYQSHPSVSTWSSPLPIISFSSPTPTVPCIGQKKTAARPKSPFFLQK